MALTGEFPVSSLLEDLRRSLMILFILEVKLLLISDAMSDASIGVPGIFSLSVIFGPKILLQRNGLSMNILLFSINFKLPISRISDFVFGNFRAELPSILLIVHCHLIQRFILGIKPLFYRCF